jgi:hypothetical protein
VRVRASERRFAVDERKMAMFQPPSVTGRARTSSGLEFPGNRSGFSRKTILSLLVLSFSTAVSASVCHQIYSSSDVLVWQGIKPPVRLDRPTIEEEVKKMVPDGHLIIIDNHSASCPPVDTRSESRSQQVRGRYGN